MFRPRIIGIAVLISASVSVFAEDSEKPSAAEYVPPTSYEEAVSHTKSTAGFKNLQKIGLAFHGYHDIFGRFPPAVSYGPDGKIPYSWRVELLPVLKHYVNQIDPQKNISTREAYDAAIAVCGYDTSQPWDSPGNRKMLESIPDEYRHPSDAPASTNAGFHAITGSGTVFDPQTSAQYADIKGWPSVTLMVAEYRSEEPWTKPIDIQYSAAAVVPRLGGFTPHGFMALSADGAVHFVPITIRPGDLRAFITKEQSDSFQIPGIPYRYN